MSSLLLQKHMTGKAGISLFEAGCEVGGEHWQRRAHQGAPKTLRSLASRARQRGCRGHAREGPRRFLGFDLLPRIGGLVYRRWFAGCLAAMGALASGVVDRGRRGGSVYFLFVMFAKLNQWCPWCLVTHVLNFGIAVCLVWMWRIVKRSPVANVARGAAAPRNGTPPAQAMAPVRGVHPSGRCVRPRCSPWRWLSLGNDTCCRLLLPR